LVSPITPVDRAQWAGSASSDQAAALERGEVLFMPALAFEVTAPEQRLFSPGLVAAAKNVSFDPHTRRLGGTTLEGADRASLGALLGRFSAAALALVEEIAPAYRRQIVLGRASFRPVEIAGRATSWRKDDTRLHIDSFPATPVHGNRILRVFTNVNPSGRARTWRLGEEFEAVARRFATAIHLPMPGSGTLLRLLRITKSRRSAYDALMLQLHDRMKGDAEYQSTVPQVQIDFPAGSTWAAFTDQVSHAAMAGQYQLEQTFLVPVEAMLDAQRAPLRVLERLKGRPLV
jgi:3-deoxy-D-manno-oct-2-ulosonic acid (Kdo) hydroxylase